MQEVTDMQEVVDSPLQQTPPPDLAQDLSPQVEAPVEADPKGLHLSKLSQSDTVTDSFLVLDDYLEAGGNLEELQQDQNLSEQARFAVEHEIELRQTIDANRELLINPASTSEQLKPILTELLNTRTGAEEQLFTALDSDLSVNQKTRLQTEIQAINKQEQDKRFKDLQELRKDLTPEEQAELAQSVDTYPNLIEKFDLSTEEQAQLESLKTEVPQQTESTKESQKIQRKDYIFLALMYLKEPRRFQQVLNKLVREKTIDPLLTKLGINPELINVLNDFRYNPSNERMQMPTNRLYKQLQRMDRYEMREFLEDLKQEDRLQLVTGEHRTHQFSTEERQELFYANGKLTQRDCELLEIPTEVK